MSTATASALPGRYVLGLEHGLQQPLVRPVVRNAMDLDAGGQEWHGGARQERHAHAIAGGDLALDPGQRERGGAPPDDVERPGHQNPITRPAHETRTTRRAARRRSGISARVPRTIGWPSPFQSASAGTAAPSTWNGTPSRFRFSRNFATSSPSTRSSVSASSRCSAGPASTNVTWFSPATMPTPMRIASKARPLARGSWVIRTRTGSSATTGRSVERDEALGGVDQVGQHHEPAVGHAVRVFERDAALLAAVGAHEEPGAAIGQRAHARVVERTNAVVDQVK